MKNKKIRKTKEGTLTIDIDDTNMCTQISNNAVNTLESISFAHYCVEDDQTGEGRFPVFVDLDYYGYLLNGRLYKDSL